MLSKDGRIALVEQHGNSWSLPKGGVEDGETPLQAALREIHEETGLSDLMLLGELGTYSRYSIAPGGVGENTALGERPRTFFLFRASEEVLRPRDKEVTQARWATLDEALTLLTHPKDREFLASVASRVQAALQ